MANSRSARKRIRVNETKRIRNNGVRTSVRTKITKARRVLLGGEADAETMTAQLITAIKALDKAAEKGILHANNVRRRKSRLASMAAKILAASTGDDEAANEARAVAAGGQKGRSVKGGTPKAVAKGKGTAKAKSAVKAPAAPKAAATKTTAKATTTKPKATTAKAAAAPKTPAS